MRGYGESDLPLSTESYRFEYLVTDVKDIVEYLGKGTTPTGGNVFFQQGLESKINLSLRCPGLRAALQALHDKLHVSCSHWMWDTDTEPAAS